MFQPWIENRRSEYVTQKFVKDKLQTLLSTNGKPNVRLIRELVHFLLIILFNFWNYIEK